MDSSQQVLDYHTLANSRHSCEEHRLLLLEKDFHAVRVPIGIDSWNKQLEVRRILVVNELFHLVSPRLESDFFFGFQEVVEAGIVRRYAERLKLVSNHIVESLLTHRIKRSTETPNIGKGVEEGQVLLAILFVSLKSKLRLQ